MDSSIFLLRTSKGHNSAIKPFQEKLEYMYPFFSYAKPLGQIFAKNSSKIRGNPRIKHKYLNGNTCNCEKKETVTLMQNFISMCSQI